MFAVVKSGGKQYRVREGQELVLDRVKGEVGDSVELPVGFTVDDEGFDLGARTARVEILEHLRGEKITSTSTARRRTLARRPGTARRRPG